MQACAPLKVSTFAYYAKLGDATSACERSVADLLAQAEALHTESNGRYRAPRIDAELSYRPIAL